MDHINSDINILQETTIDTPSGKIPQVTIDSPLQSFEVKNWNERIYGGSLVMNSIDNDGMIQNDIKHGQWIGEFGHPLDLSPRRQVILYPPTASHRILNYRREGNLLKGHVQTLPYGYGISMANNSLHGVPAAFSLRSLGSVDIKTGRVNAPLKVITYDSVYRPSHIEAYEDKILSECVEASNDLFTIISESAVMVPISETMAQITDYVKDRSNNLKMVSEIFKIDNLDCTLDECGTRMNIKIDDETRVNVPIESMINLEYSDILSSVIKKK
jgi:hypothetical protein